MERNYEINPSLQLDNVGRGRISTRPKAVRWSVPTTSLYGNEQLGFGLAN